MKFNETFWEKSWVEAMGLLFIAIGFLVALTLRSPTFTYLSVFLAGMVAGRVYYLKRYAEPILPFVLIILGFLLGYLTGSIWANRVVILLLFILAMVLSYYLHVKQIVATFKSESFLK